MTPKDIMTRICPQCGALLEKEMGEVISCARCGWIWNSMTLTWQEFKDYMKDNRCKQCDMINPEECNPKCMECYGSYLLHWNKERKNG